jgi:hypothetical protein
MSMIAHHTTRLQNGLKIEIVPNSTNSRFEAARVSNLFQSHGSDTTTGSLCYKSTFQ